MPTPLIHDRGRGAEISGTRITIDTLLPHFLDPDQTEAGICQLYELSAEQVAAARAHVLNHPDAIMGKYLEIEARLDPENPPEVIEKAARTRETLLDFKKWLEQREKAESQAQAVGVGSGTSQTASGSLLTFKEWLSGRESRADQDS